MRYARRTRERVLNIEHGGVSEKSPDRENACIPGVVADADSGMAAGGMDDPVISHIDRNVAFVADDISRQCFGQTGNFSAALADRGVIVRKINDEMCVDRHDKAGTVNAFCQA